MSSKKRSSNFLKGVAKYRVDQEVTDLVVERFLSSLDCPRSLAVWLLYKNQEFSQLRDLDFDPNFYNTSQKLADAYAASEFLSKYQGFTSGADKDSAAYEKFTKFENLCKRTNARFRNLAMDPLFHGPVVWLHSAVKQKIAWILGEFSPEEFFSSPDWGPGASTLVKRIEASSPIKFQREAGITRDLYAVVDPLLKEAYPSWYRQLTDSGYGTPMYPRLTVGNTVITVPKNAWINRVIAIEPGINLWFQLSVGKMIRRRLRRVGINLRRQEVNQLLAKIGSITQYLVTVDLSSASDSIALLVAREVLPDRWFEVMDVLRAHYGKINGVQVRWEKFSSMGNGFTFPLESLIFYAVAKCCAEYVGVSDGNVGTYGDDVILPASAFDLFSQMMEFYGFVINRKKSHFNSEFRESCGAHYYRGVDVKPIYLKDRVSDLSSVFSLANALRLFASRRGANLCCDARFRSVFELLMSKVPAAFRLRVPKHFGDVGFISNFDEATPRKAKDRLEGFQVHGLMKLREERWFDGVGLLLSDLWRIEKRAGRTANLDVDTDNRDMLSWLTVPSMAEATDLCCQMGVEKDGYNTIPGSRSKWQEVWAIARQWPDLGPWLDLDQTTDREVQV